jgi:peptide deformylase
MPAPTIRISARIEGARNGASPARPEHLECGEVASAWRREIAAVAVRPILRLGDPILREIAVPVRELDTSELHALVADMIETMHANDGAGLAAIQIGVLQRVVIFGLEDNPRYPEVEPVPLTVLVNPEIELLGSERESGWEGCLSVPGMRGLVPRFTKLRYRGHDAFGRPIDRTVSGFHARVVQHECDHLDGVLYPQRIEDMRSFGFTEELTASGVLRALPAEPTRAAAGGG